MFGFVLPPKLTYLSFCVYFLSVGLFEQNTFLCDWVLKGGFLKILVLWDLIQCLLEEDEQEVK